MAERIRLVVIAPTKAAGRAQVARLPDVSDVDVVAIITPRSPHGARGLVADFISFGAMLDHPKLDALLAEASPCLATREPPQ